MIEYKPPMGHQDHERLPKYWWAFFSKLLEVGFSREEAIQLLESHIMRHPK